MIVRFTIPRKAVSVNDGYVRAGWNSNRGGHGGKGMVLSPAGRDFKDAARAHALVAARQQGWPKLEAVKRVQVTLRAWNSRHDIDAPIKFSLDSLEGVIYANDPAVRRLVIEEPGKDDRPPRVDVAVELLPDLA